MDWLISSAMAQQAGSAAQPSLMAQLFPLVALIVLFYFMLIRPQMKRNKEHKSMVSGISKGDEVVTSGGLAGRVTAVGEVYMTVEIAEGTEVKVQKAALAQVLPKGSLKQL
ncbi:preprotein translocase subunit YajC [Oceanococcus atlanticus]|uniref:Sec translocon accessory complex subunit YajC n=1 Tax=Oceanococcus atlanticus TaxID=1317117 RepID=A0A1Y1SFB8_9GAMM|nr:preprotein translocase subunit YajC [Oceanococcus atlanticus]ORE88343.1 preprotein translocase subunit YajC [Oceanococcus atlanticus]RZO85574.1 MAG: preprotein translocase subunit YajC [Oceanococcus sp.]